jgi:hypothetical protein
MEKNLLQYQSLTEFFSDKVKQALKQENLSVSDEVEFYLVNILSHFSLSENYHKSTQNGKLEDRALALKLYDATFDEANRISHLRNLGDTALYRAGVFYESLFNQVVDVDYYINMGGSAYRTLSQLTTTSPSHVSTLFDELSNQFPKLVEVMHLTTESEAPTNDHDLFRLIDRYNKTGSEKAKELLKEKGISLDLLTIDKRPQ